MLGSLVAYVGQQIVDLENPENFKNYLVAIEKKAFESLIKSLSGDTNEEHYKKSVL